MKYFACSMIIIWVALAVGWIMNIIAIAGSSVIGRIGRLLIFPIVWVLTGKARL